MKHKDEPEVQSFMILEKRSDERRLEIAILRKRRNDIFNLKQKKDEEGNPGKIKVSRCLNDEQKQGGGNYARCPNCKGWYTTNNLRHHYHDCKDGWKTSKGILVKARKAQGQIHERASYAMRYKIIPMMKMKMHVKFFRYDFLMILFGNEECLKYRKRNLAQMIRGKLSLITRFLIVLKEIDLDVTDFASIYNPARYPNFIKAINQFTGLDKENGFYKILARASEIVTDINKMGQILINEGIVKKETEQ